MIERGASDLHLTTGSPPRLRIVGKLLPIEDHPTLSPENTKELCYSIMTDPQRAKFEENNELDLSFGIKGLSRFRANIFMQRGALAGVFRSVPFVIKNMSDLGLPSAISDMVAKKHGLVIVSGPAGSGKSTTIASMIDSINSEREAHIITLEDPVEFLHHHNKSIINQREISADTASYSAALRYILRQNPDIVFLDEMQSIDTIESVFRIAETGHLALATLRTKSALQTISRIIEIFPPHQQEQVRIQLASILEGIVSQRLIPTKDGQGRVLALEVLIPSAAVRSLMRENKLSQIYSIMQTGGESSGMITMNQSIAGFFSKGLVSYEDAVNHSPLPEELAQLLAKKNAPESRYRV